jgi:hypothetical protein
MSACESELVPPIRDLGQLQMELLNGCAARLPLKDWEMYSHDARAALSVALPSPVEETAHQVDTTSISMAPTWAGPRQRTRRAVVWGIAVVREAFWLVVILLCLPLGVLAIGLPIAAVARVAEWLLSGL